jgi:hypothetical protein
MSQAGNAKLRGFITATALAEFVTGLQAGTLRPRPDSLLRDQRRRQGTLAHQRHHDNVRRYR